MTFAILYYRNASTTTYLITEGGARALFTFFIFSRERAHIRKRKRENCKDFLSKDSVTRLVIYDICYCITEMPLPQLI